MFVCLFLEMKKNCEWIITFSQGISLSELIQFRGSNDDDDGDMLQKDEGLLDMQDICTLEWRRNRGNVILVLVW